MKTLRDRKEAGVMMMMMMIIIIIIIIMAIVAVSIMRIHRLGWLFQ